MALFDAARARGRADVPRHDERRARRALARLRVHHGARGRRRRTDRACGADRRSRSSACGPAASPTASGRSPRSGRSAPTPTSSARRATPTSSARSTTRPATATTGPPRTWSTCPTRRSTRARPARDRAAGRTRRSSSSSPGAARSPVRPRALAARRPRGALHRPPAAALGGPGRRRAQPTRGHAFRSDVQRWSIGATYPNFLGDEGSARMSAAFGASAQRLGAVKAKWDPHGASAPTRRSEGPTTPTANGRNK